LIYGGTNGAIAPVLDAAKRAGVPCGVDLEDYHCEEAADTPAGRRWNERAATLMEQTFREAALVTAGSAAIADACAERFGTRPLPINNVFPLPQRPPRARARKGSLRLYWFSQTVGGGRGLEDAVRAVGLARVACELHLRGVPAAGYVATLERTVSQHAPGLRLVWHQPADPDAMVDACREFDAGLAVEQLHPRHRQLTLSNKALTYPLAGLAVVVTDLPGQRPLLRDLGNDAIAYGPGDADVLADGLARWSSSPASLRRAQEAAWVAAERRWHWEHAEERGALVAAVGRLA
jgi:hypothetical protein